MPKYINLKLTQQVDPSDSTKVWYCVSGEMFLPTTTRTPRVMLSQWTTDKSVAEADLTRLS